MMESLTLIVQILYVGFFGWAAFAKLTRHPHMVEEFEKFGLPYGLALFAGLGEAVAVGLLTLGFVVPLAQFAGFAVLVPLMTGAAVINFWKRPVAFGAGVVALFVLPSVVLAALHAGEAGF